MGWTSYHATFYKNGQVDRKAELDNLYKTDSENDKYSFKTLKSAMYGSVYYAAIESTEKETGKKEVFALVCLTHSDINDYHNFSYKDMDETCNPFYYDCPERILNLLTPTTNAMATEWRNLCREKINLKKEIKNLDKFGEKGGRIAFYPKYDLSSGIKAGERLELHYHTIIYPYKKKEKSFWTDGKYSYSRALLMRGRVEKIEKGDKS